MPALFATPAFWYFVISTYLTYEMTRQQAIQAKEQADAQTEMAEENARLQIEMQEKAQEQNIEKGKQLNLAEEMEREKLAEQKLQQDIQYKQIYGSNVAQLGDASMTGNTVDRIFGTIDRRLAENKLSIDRDIDTLGSNFSFARKNLQTQTDMGVLGSDLNINAMSTGKNMGMSDEVGYLKIGSGLLDSATTAYKIDSSVNPKYSYGRNRKWYGN